MPQFIILTLIIDCHRRGYMLYGFKILFFSYSFHNFDGLYLIEQPHLT